MFNYKEEHYKRVMFIMFYTIRTKVFNPNYCYNYYTFYK